MPSFPADGSAVPRQRQQLHPSAVRPATIGGPLDDAPSAEQLRLFARALMAAALELHRLPGGSHSGDAADQPDQAQEDREGRDADSSLTAQENHDAAESSVAARYVEIDRSRKLTK